jgi:peptidoglycan/LPS O-acetylase OafA/YrhL
VIKNGLFLQTVRPGGSSLLEVAWSLVIEEWSYALVSVLLFGAALMAWKPSPRRAAISLLAVAGVLSVVSTAARVLASDAAWMSWDALKKVPWLHMDSLAAGMALASAELLMPNAFRRLAGLGFRNGIVAVLGSFALGSWANRFMMPGGGPITPRDWATFGGLAYPIAGLLCCLFLMGLWNLEFTHWPKWISGITRWGAKTSYSLYLVQVPVAQLIARLLPDWNGYAAFTVYACVAGSAGIVGWIMLEAPFLRLRAKLRADD